MRSQGGRDLIFTFTRHVWVEHSEAGKPASSKYAGWHTEMPRLTSRLSATMGLAPECKLRVPLSPDNATRSFQQLGVSWRLPRWFNAIDPIQIAAVIDSG
jgi:hypothetical protein